MALLLGVPASKKTDNESDKAANHSEYRIDGYDLVYSFGPQFYSQGANPSLMKALSMREKRRGTLFVLKWAFLVFVLAGCTGVVSEPQAQPSPFKILTVPASPDKLPVSPNPETNGSIPHDTEAFTQGLVFHKGSLYESTGRNGESKIRRLNPVTGEVEKETALDDAYFGEGLATLNDQFYQLTWRSGVCLQYGRDLDYQKTIIYGAEGWGLTVEPETGLLIFSDGSPEIRFLDPTNFITKRKITVLDGNKNPVPYLNELEWVNGEIWANVWTSETICRIDPASGQVLGWIKFHDLVSETQTGPEDVLNGIAYDPDSDVLWITGKLWPAIYKIEDTKQVFFASSPSSNSQ